MNLLSDLETLTQTKRQVFEYLTDLSIADISQCVLEEYNTNGKFCSVDIGIGTLNFIFEQDELQFKFVPSKKLEDSIFDAISSNKSSLQEMIENKINSRMIKLYKELI